MQHAYVSFPSSGNGRTAEILVGRGADAVAILRIGMTPTGATATVLDSTVGDVDLSSLVAAIEQAQSVFDPSPLV